MSQHDIFVIAGVFKRDAQGNWHYFPWSAGNQGYRIENYQQLATLLRFEWRRRSQRWITRLAVPVLGAYSAFEALKRSVWEAIFWLALIGIVAFGMDWLSLRQVISVLKKSDLRLQKNELQNTRTTGQKNIFAWLAFLVFFVVTPTLCLIWNWRLEGQAKSFAILITVVVGGVVSGWLSGRSVRTQNSYGDLPPDVAKALLQQAKHK